MALLIRPEHRNRFSCMLEKVYRLRQRVFVDQMGWQIPGNDGQLECDAYDLGACCHLAVLGPDGDVRATIRLTPSLAPNLSCDVLQQQMGGKPFPRAAHIAESSRVCLDPDLVGEPKHEAYLDLRVSSRELYKAMGWTHNIAVGYEGQLTRWVRSGMALQVLSGPVLLPGDKELAMGVLTWEDQERPDAVTQYLGGRSGSLQDPAEDPSLFSRFGDRAAA
jgi:N-acyl-L-homoserine lactone synthetase